MLVVTRSVGERFVIGDEIIVTVVQVHGDSVTLGFRDRDGMPVHVKDMSDYDHRHQPASLRSNVPTERYACVDLG